LKKRGLIWKIPTALIGVVLGLVLLLLIGVASVLCDSSLRTKVLREGLRFANEKTDYDIDLGGLYLSPFHHSPKLLYRAYKGEADLPLEIQIDSLFIGHRGHDTLIYTRALRLKATCLTSNSESGLTGAAGLTSIPIVVDHLRLESTTFNSDSLIAAVGIDAKVGLLDVSSPELCIATGNYPLHGLRLYDADVAIDLRGTPDTTAQDTTPLLLAFDLPDADLRNIRYTMTPLNLGIRTRSLSTQALVDVGANVYDARRLNIDGLTFSLGELSIPTDTIYGNAFVNLNNNLITSSGLHVRSDEMGANVDLYATKLNLETMGIEVTADAEYQGSQVRVQASYDIDDEAYDATVHIDRVNLSPFASNLSPLSLMGTVEAQGRGIDPKKPMQSKVKLRLDQAIYGDYNLSHTTFEGSTDSVTSLALTMPGFKADIQSPMPLMTLIDRIQPLVNTVSDTAVITALTSLKDLSALDTIRRQIPPLQTDITLRKGSPIQAIIDSTGLDFQRIDLALRSDATKTTFTLSPFTFNFTNMRLPAVQAELGIAMTEGKTDVALTADMTLTDGAMSFYDLCTDASFRLDMKREGRNLYGNGQLKLDSIVYGDKDLGSHDINLQIDPSSLYANALRASIFLDDIPLELVSSFVSLTDVDLNGAIRASATIDGLPYKPDISAEVKPLGVRAKYTPYDIGISLGSTPIVMNHNHVDLNGLPIYAADSTYLALSGGLDLDSMNLDITLKADSFAPAKLPQGGPLPVYGELATDIRGRVFGPLDNIVADVDVTLLPVTDITYPIDKKNLAQVKPHGTVSVHCPVSNIDSLTLAGRIHVDDGFVRYSPKVYPMMPFHVDSGSHVSFHGPIGATELAISASQKVKADVESEGEDTRRVDFTTGVRVNGTVDSIGLHSIGFFLEAPDDEAITHELESLDEDTREGLAATLLATGMYVGESNVAAQRDGYALSSIINSRINAAMSNSKLGKVVDIDISSGQSSHVSGTTNDMNISISKSFFKDRLRLTVGSTLTDNPEVNDAYGMYMNFSADYKLTKNGDVRLRLYSQRDYNNVFEGELYKSGLAVISSKEWRKTTINNLKHQTRTESQTSNTSDSITRIYGLAADAGVAYRSNNSLGPDLTVKSTIKNLFGKGETFTIKGNGAYYWALRNRHPGDPKKTDTYKLGVTASLIFPYLHWGTTNAPKGDTRYLLGYQYENIAGGYGVHKLSGSFTYFIRSPHSSYITHAFTPFSLSVVLMKAETDSLYDKAAEFPELIKIIAGDEFVPSIGYNFYYNNYRSKRAVNTFLDLGVKESGNIINAIYGLFGRTWNEKNKPLGKITFNQFVKLHAELRNRFNFTDKVSIATRLYAGANVPLGNAEISPLSEAFYTGGPNSLRAASPYAYGPGNFHSPKYNQNFFHAGDVKLEANFELRFPIVWKLFGAAFVDAGNVWNWYSSEGIYKAAGIDDIAKRLEINYTLYDGILDNPELAKQIALGTGAGLRLDLDGIVVRLDIGVGIHAPYQTYRYDKEGKPDYNAPITTYFNIPSALDAIRVNFGIGYPF
jgi:hypothetical protein